MTPDTKAAREAVARAIHKTRQGYGFGGDASWEYEPAVVQHLHIVTADAILALPELRAAFAGEWMPIETMGFGNEEMILVLTAGGHAYTVDADKDMDGAWLVAGSKRRAEKIGEPHGANEIITHWKLLGPLPTPPSEPSNG